MTIIYLSFCVINFKNLSGANEHYHHYAPKKDEQDEHVHPTSTPPSIQIYIYIFKVFILVLLFEIIEHICMRNFKHLYIYIFFPFKF